MPEKNMTAKCTENWSGKTCDVELNGNLTYEILPDGNWDINPYSDIFLKARSHHKIYPQCEGHKVFDLFKKNQKIGYVSVDRWGYVYFIDYEGHRLKYDGDPEP